ncbi:unnamed protein product [Gadus morhua 'NCC']
MASTSVLLCALALLSCWTALATRAPAEGGAGGGGLNQLLGRGGAGETSPRGDLHTRVSRMEKMTLSELERELRTKEIMAAISEMVNSGCPSSRDYQGWVDFGRRSAERTE